MLTGQPPGDLYAVLHGSAYDSALAQASQPGGVVFLPVREDEPSVLTAPSEVRTLPALSAEPATRTSIDT